MVWVERSEEKIFVEIHRVTDTETVSREGKNLKRKH